ncbi:hypothetical protein KUD11_10005 [Roseovarius sp. LXJ103]|uniref:hypothetical protein n=1 Tax=Roseovarius carneus TaxID=2853164 RepID=UPI000D60A348|nr:hypothetical protein [Roseovarius carneus]MBZ8118980.1 hypothetical protein [Roseovarius carneus]PWE35367.1 hypothetical protein DD563_04950 [Pelagicola sp. LXJ1103]
MDILLHLGAHRTASTSFQHYLRRNVARLEAGGTAVWGPQVTRNGLLTGALPMPGIMSAAEQFTRAKGRVSLALAKAEGAGAHRVVMTDENLIGATRRNLRDMRLYPGAGERLARYYGVLGGRLRRVVFSIRSQDVYWNSCLAFSAARGGYVPGPVERAHIAGDTRTWRDVITDMACALPGVEIIVAPYETFGGLPEHKLALLLGDEARAMPRCHARELLNASPDLPALRAALQARGADWRQLPEGEGSWQIFSQAERVALREAYADDLFWLRAGADGLATLTEKTDLAGAGITPPTTVLTRGQEDDTERRRMA